jgi:ribonuclease HI
MGLGIAWFGGNDILPIHVKSINMGGKLGTSNEAEYHAIIYALYDLIHRPIWDSVVICSDSQIIISQLTGKFAIREPRLIKLHSNVFDVIDLISADITFQWVPRTNPRQQIVDKLSKDGNPYFIENSRAKVL